MSGLREIPLKSFCVRPQRNEGTRDEGFVSEWESSALGAESKDHTEMGPLVQ